MTNRRHGSSWSLSGKGEVCGENVDPFMAVYGVRKEKIQGIYQSKEWPVLSTSKKMTRKWRIL